MVAAGIYLAATTGQAELIVSGTAAAFSLATRVSPRLIAFLMCRLGFDGQLTRDPEAARLEQPTLFAPAAAAAGVRGPFGKRARGYSIQLWASRHAAALLAGAALGLAAVRFIRRPASP